MTRVDDLLAEIELLTSGAVSYTSKSAANDLYEGFVFALIVRAARAAGATSIHYENVHGSVVSNLLFRTSPGLIYSTVQDYTHAVLTFANGETLEVHVGVRVQGRSGVLHECDVLVLPKSEADLARSKSVSPRGSKCLVAVECKFYSSPPGLALAREFHGLHADLGAKFPHYVTNLRSRASERLLTSLRREWEGDVVPATDESKYLEGAFRRAFKFYTTMQGGISS